ncbi:unnamed protein product [Notodromas monacha]|uniref:Phenylethanolamine N-methyltransferase n=1 Tax=Notodromas monacha TaxID=399045 RepID=A0A7R9GH91_9CRUS|nr:unnamed protein product [Notodromas monacha]CAG0921226.1 unnamed protein product [Notodromas monacha]
MTLEEMPQVKNENGIVGSRESGSALDLGCGPVPSFSASISSWANSLTMADFLPQNLFEIFKWKTNSCGKLDWFHHFNTVAKLEDVSAKQVELRLRRRVEKIISCDVSKENPIFPHKNLFDVVFTSLCLEFATDNLPDYQSAFKNAANLVKPGGFLIVQGALGNTFYMLGGTRFPSVALTREILADCAKMCNLKTELWNQLDRKCGQKDKEADHDAIFFFVASKRI